MEGGPQHHRRHGATSLNASFSTGQLADLTASSAQHIRNLEAEGVIPPSIRAANGYRQFTPRHLHAVLAYAALSAALGPVAAKAVMRELQAEPRTSAIRMDELHAALHAERTTLRRAVTASSAISAEAMGEQHAGDAMTIGLLASALDVRPSTLRHWEREGLLTPQRRGRTRSYSPNNVRDARIVDQLRRAGYRIPDLRAILDELRRTGLPADVLERLDRRGQALDARSRALLTAGVHLLELTAATRE
ncbi:MerR family transcriptional regulator [Ruania zhangjianzhongii]|uniref:MerR family transcriptional regulator n=1 Tax=Ruania zhangjianzhongii TaxID=2603206 RepID=UPI0011C95AD4|nr:MerR family transcriptional regulator [Ruania zhangjianzhongii]